MAFRHPGPDGRRERRPLKELFLERCRAVVDRAARWCPEAEPEDADAALARFAFERADIAGMANSMGLDRPEGWPLGAERDLLDACERILEIEHIDLLDGISPLREIHPLGRGIGPQGETCATCAWFSRSRCLQGGDSARAAPKARRAWPSCARWEPVLSDSSCGSCGACCRQGYSLAPVGNGEPMAAVHPEWIRRDGRRACLPRPNGRCVALEGDGSPSTPWRCRAYEIRPRACADLSPGSHACLVARRRTGLSR